MRSVMKAVLSCLWCVSLEASSAHSPVQCQHDWNVKWDINYFSKLYFIGERERFYFQDVLSGPRLWMHIVTSLIYRNPNLLFTSWSFICSSSTLVMSKRAIPERQMNSRENVLKAAFKIVFLGNWMYPYSAYFSAESCLACHWRFVATCQSARDIWMLLWGHTN